MEDLGKRCHSHDYYDGEKDDHRVGQQVQQPLPEDHDCRDHCRDDDSSGLVSVRGRPMSSEHCEQSEYDEHFVSLECCPLLRRKERRRGSVPRIS
jgi:hypothetical protein